MTLREYSAKVTYREHLTWIAYLDADLEAPDRHDLYIMQLTSIVASFVSGKRVSINDMQLKFSKPVFPKEAMERSKATWLGMLGIDPTGKYKPGKLYVDRNIPDHPKNRPAGAKRP